MNYTSFLLKKVYKNKLNIIPFILFMGFIIFMYSIYRTDAYNNILDPSLSGEDIIVHLENRVSVYQNMVDSEELSYEEKEKTQELIDAYQKRIDCTKKRSESFRQKNWQEYYRNDIGVNEANYTIYSEELDTNKDYISFYLTNKMFSQLMLEYGNGYDNSGLGIQGVSFITTVYRFFIAVFLSIIMIYITSRLYCSTTIDKMDIQHLLPYSAFKRQCSRLYAGLWIGFGIVLFFSILAILCGTMGSSLGNLNTPIAMYSIEGKEKYILFIEILPQLLILLLLVVGFIANAVQCISLFCKKGMTCMLLSFVVILGGYILLPDLVQMSKYLHLIPTSYLSFFNVLTGEVAYNVQNIGINFTNGVIVLVISNAVLMTISYIVTRRRIKRV